MQEKQTQQQQLQTQQPSTPSDRFTQEVQRQFSDAGGKIVLTEFQKKLINNYFLKLDGILKVAEIKRLATQEEYRDGTPYTWQNVNIAKLAIDAVVFSSVGLDPMQPNHINPIPYKNFKTGLFDVTFIMGYRGLEIKARKYGLDVPDEVIVELVHSTDTFKALKKDKNQPFDSYEFSVNEPFQRGEVVGGFYYHSYKDSSKNKLVLFDKKAIDKRKPNSASAEFWGGAKDVWSTGENGKRVKTAQQLDGWYEEMAFKTIYRAAYNAITIDSQKIDDHYVAILERERESLSGPAAEAIAQNANTGETIGFDDDVQTQDQPEQPALEAAAEMPEQPAPNMAQPQAANQTNMFSEQASNGRGF